MPPPVVGAPATPDRREAHSISTTARTHARPRRRVSRRVAFLALGGACLLSGLNAALVAVGVWAPVPANRLPDIHGMVMVLGFMGTLISLERAQALGRAWGYLAPTLLAAGGIFLTAGLHLLGQLLLLQGCLLFGAVYLALWKRARLPLITVQLLAVTLAAVAAGFWLSIDLAALLPLLAGFLVITIAAERAELAQLTMGRRAVPTLLVFASVIALAAIASLLWPEPVTRVFGFALLTTAAWLLRDDVPRRMIRAHGLHRYNGATLFAGYLWLALAGATWLLVGVPGSEASYDIVIHASFLGFGVSMIMAHAPIIFPAVIGRPLPYRPVLWVPVAVLNIGMVARVVGDLTGRGPLWEAGSVITVAAMLIFVLTAVGVVIRGE